MKRNDFKYGWLAAIAVAGLASCSDSEGPDVSEEVAQDIVLTGKSRAAAEQLGDFYVRLTQDAADYVDSDSSFDDKSFVISPLSASMVLAMTGNAVEGNLREEIVNYLGTDDLEGMNELAGTLLAVLPSIDRKTTLNLANSVWVNNNYKLNAGFNSLITEDYMGTVHYFNSGDASGTAADINRWCSSNTGNMIREYVSPSQINSGLMALLLNAMNFKSEWREKDLFDSKDTQNALFHGQKGNFFVKMMKGKQTGMTCYLDDDIVYTSLPFGNNAFSLEILMAAEGKMFGEMSLEADLQQARNEREYFKYVTLRLPRFKAGGDLDLNDILKAGGLNHVYGSIPLALFTEEKEGMISFHQKAVFEVDEKGAKAAAVSSAKFGDLLPLNPETPIEITVDRPFYFFITEKSTGACVVSGRITDLPEVSN